MNNKGFIGSMILFVQLMVITAVTSAGLLFDGGNPTGSAFFIATNGLVTYSQMPHVVKDFRQDKAIKMCEETGATDCVEMVASWSDDDVMDYIRDDEPAMIRTNGGNFINGNMNGT